MFARPSGGSLFVDRPPDCPIVRNEAATVIPSGCARAEYEPKNVLDAIDHASVHTGFDFKTESITVNECRKLF